MDLSYADAVYPVLNEWLEEMERDYNHPSIVGWCPFNETWDIDGRKQNDIILETVYRASKALDKTRPVIDTSGNYHVVTDIYDCTFTNRIRKNLPRFSKRSEKAGSLKTSCPVSNTKKGSTFS